MTARFRVRLRPVVAMSMVAAGLLVVAGGAPVSASTGFGSTWTVYHENSIGTGVDPSGTDLSPASAAWTSPALDGQIYGEPLVEAGRVYVATENNTVYALAADTGAVMWQTHIAAPVPSSALPCGDISPTVGITSTPVIDPSLGEIFVVADEAVGGGGAEHHLVGLDLFTGHALFDAVVDPLGSVPLDQLQRPALALDGHNILVGFGGNDGDCGTYNGWLVSVSENGGFDGKFEIADASGDSKGAVWMGGAAPAVDSAGNIWFATGNSTFGSSSDAYDLSDGVIELSPSLELLQYFAPSDWYADNGSDRDLGSSSPAFIGNGLVFQAGKSQTAYVMDQSSLGGVGGQRSSLGSFCGGNVDGGSAVSGAVVYSPCQAGIVATTVAAGSPPTVSVDWQTSTGATGPPIVAGGLVWSIDPSSGILYGLNPSNGTSVQQFSLGSEPNHFPTPAVADGLLLAASSDQVHAFAGPAGLPPAPGGYWGGVTVDGPDVVYGSPSVGIEPNGAPTVFVNGPTGDLVNYWYDPHTGGFDSLTVSGPNTIWSDPVVAIEPNGAPTVFAKGPNNALVNYWYDPSTGRFDTATVAGPGTVATDPVVAIEPNGAPTVFVQGPNGALVNYWYIPQTGGFGAVTVTNPGAFGYSAGRPAVALEPNGAPTVFVAGPNGALVNYWYIPQTGGFGAVTVTGPGAVYSDPAVAIEPNGAPTVFVAGPNEALVNYWYVPATGGFDAATLSAAQSAFADPAVAIGPNGAPTVFVDGPSNSLANYLYDPTTGAFDPSSVSGPGVVPTSASPSVGIEPNGTPTVFVEGPNNALVNYWYIQPS